MAGALQSNNDLGAPRRVVVLYHYFAHYREAVIRELLEHGHHRYDFAGDTKDHGQGIRLTHAIPRDRFVRAACHLMGPLVLQPRAIGLALSGRYDTLILLGNSKWPTTWLAAILGRLRGKRVLFWTHGWLKREPGLAGRVRNTFYRLAHGLLLYGHNAKCIGLANGFDADRLHVIYNSLDYREQDRVRGSLDAESVAARRREVYGDDDRPAVMAITRLQPAKKLDMLVEAAAVCEKRGRPVSLLFVGDGPDRQRLEAIAGEHGVRARFAGAVYDEPSIAEYLAASDLCVIPGPAGLTVMHSLAYGTPFVTNDDTSTQMPEFEAVVQGVNGALFKAWDTEDLAAQILACTETAELRERGRAESIEIIERFFNPVTQRVLIDRAVSGHKADDLWAAWHGPLYRTAGGKGSG
ncbi:MAG: glycosyltransferase family 4 protein [Phycisphaeraceae bacterium]|nr:MAG: glycosyltransferase family 4 protein [Phycisphaeraceae bacterium]